MPTAFGGTALAGLAALWGSAFAILGIVFLRMVEREHERLRANVNVPRKHD